MSTGALDEPIEKTDGAPNSVIINLIQEQREDDITNYAYL